MTIPVYSEIFEGIQKQLEGLRALGIASLDSGIVEQVIADPSLDAGILSELATLLRIAQFTSETTDTGRLVETSWTAESSVILAHRVSPDNFLILVGRAELQLGFARYVLRKAAWQLRPQLVGAIH